MLYIEPIQGTNSKSNKTADRTVLISYDEMYNYFEMWYQFTVVKTNALNIVVVHYFTLILSVTISLSLHVHIPPFLPLQQQNLR